jgi:hypothetical protein
VRADLNASPAQIGPQFRIYSRNGNIKHIDGKQLDDFFCIDASPQPSCLRVRTVHTVEEFSNGDNADTESFFLAVFDEVADLN